MFIGGLGLLVALIVLYSIYLDVTGGLGSYVSFWYFTSDPGTNMMLRLLFTIGMPSLLILSLIGPYCYKLQKKDVPN